MDVAIISRFRAFHYAVTFLANRIAGGDAVITLSDESGSHSLINVDINGCSWPTPHFDVIDPSPNAPAIRLIKINVPARTKQEDDNEKRGTFSYQLVIEVQRKYDGSYLWPGNYHVHVFSEDGDDLFSTLQPLSSGHLPKSVVEHADANSEYFQSTVNGLRKSVIYDIEFWQPAGLCPTPIAGGGYSF